MGRFQHARNVLALLVYAPICLCASGIWFGPAEAETLRTSGQFVGHALPSTMYLDDLGVADVNDDGLLDIYTTNHQAQPLILVNQQDGAFKNDVLRLRLGTAQDYVGADPNFNDMEPIFDRSGLYIYWHFGHLVVRAHRIPKSTPASGAIFVSRGEILDTDGSVTVAEHPVDPTGWKEITFVMSESSTITIESVRTYFYSPRFEIGDKLPLDAIYIGAERANPASHSFRLSQSDRHGIAWLDLDDDGATDVVIANGGGGGRIRGRVEAGSGSYQVLLQRGGLFKEVFPYDELSRYGCPTRQISIVDHDGDGNLDIYVVCGRGSEQAHQLFQQAADGTFSEVAAAKAPGAKDDGLSTWLDADDDGDMDLFWTTKQEAWIYRNKDGHFDAVFVGAIRDRARQISKADYDGDGDLDIYLAAPNGSSLLIGKRGDFEIVEPERLGLPHDAVCGNWVDYNNDGIQDLHVLPGGIFEQRADHKFYQTELLETPEPPSSAFCVWFDSNNDGYRDLLVAIPREPTLFEKIRAGIARRIGEDGQVWISQNPLLFFLQGVTTGHPFFRPQISDLTLYQAIGGDRHWLEVGLTGSRGNRPAIGASVRVRTASGTQVQAIGQAEGSVSSSGHYRVYFGLGDEAHIDSVQLAWPDGSLQEIDGAASDRLVTFEQESKD
jgi:ASPIC and UnbV/FG-GAP-like repeat